MSFRARSERVVDESATALGCAFAFSPPRIPWTCFGRGANKIPADKDLIGLRASGRIMVKPDGAVLFVGLERTGEIGRVCYAPRTWAPALGSDVCGPGWELPHWWADQAIGHPKPLSRALLRAVESARRAMSTLDAPHISTAPRYELSAGSALCVIECTHAKGGRGKLTIRAHHGYLYTDGAATVPCRLLAAARVAVQVVAEEQGLRYP